MERLRSRVFDALLVAWTAMFLPALATLLLCGRPPGPIRAVSRVWARGILALLQRVVGLTHAEHGRHHVPAEPCLIVANHQSAWETIAFLLIVPDVAIVAKSELAAVPVMGWFLRHSPMIIIDRESGGAAARHMLIESRRALSAGRSVLIFPEGSRQSVAREVEFKRGVELLYRQLGVPALPVALNSGLFWGRNGASKRPGVIRVSFGPVIEAGLSSRDFARRAQRAVQTELDRHGGGDALAA